MSIYVVWFDVLELNKPYVRNVRNNTYMRHCILRSERVSRLFKKISRKLWNLTVHYRFHKISPDQSSPRHSILFFQDSFYYLPSTRRCYKRSLSFKVSIQTPVYISPFSH